MVRQVYPAAQGIAFPWPAQDPQEDRLWGYGSQATISPQIEGRMKVTTINSSGEVRHEYLASVQPPAVESGPDVGRAFRILVSLQIAGALFGFAAFVCAVINVLV